MMIILTLTLTCISSQTPNNAGDVSLHRRLGLKEDVQRLAAQASEFAANYAVNTITKVAVKNSLQMCLTPIFDKPTASKFAKLLVKVVKELKHDYEQKVEEV